MKFRTNIAPDKSPYCINHQDHILTIGSCFANEVGKKLTQSKFNVLSNPLGILFNPMSITVSLEQGFIEKASREEFLVANEQVISNYLTHSDIQGNSTEDYIKNLQNAFSQLEVALQNARWIILTWGTAWGYYLKSNDTLVASCHKQDPRLFHKKLITVDDIYQSYSKIFRETLQDKYIIITVSPVRHIRDTLRLNQVSKSILHLAAHHLSEDFPHVTYFPAFEIMMDDLRDYRFYQRDLIHPTDFAVDYIWEKFKSQWFSPQTLELILRWDKVNKSIQHRPFATTSQAYRTFLHHLRVTIQSFKEFPVHEELNKIDSLLKSIN